MWRWAADVAPTVPLPSFATQADAEAWLTGHYEELVTEGAGAVSLYEGDRLVYGPMSLAAE